MHLNCMLYLILCSTFSNIDKCIITYYTYYTIMYKCNYNVAYYCQLLYDLLHYAYKLYYFRQIKN